MTLAQITDAWHGSGTADDPYRPQLPDTYQIVSCVDVTGTPSNKIGRGAAVVVQCLVDDYVMTRIEADPNYGPGAVLWSQPYP
jgi:hypothetical protein